MLPDYIILSENAGSALEKHLNKAGYSQIAILADENTRKHCYPIIASLLGEHHVIEIESGEINKTLATCEQIWEALTVAQFDRSSVLVNLGGGVIGDIGGFCAATYKRGKKFINIPTTLLAQVDASMGGKTGVDFHGLKNHIGLFKEPELVIVDAGFLTTLPDAQMRSGFAEMIKHGLIADEQYFHDLMNTNWEDHKWPEVVARSMAIKQNIVEADPLESGPRKLLNFGHTIGHAIESYHLAIGKSLLHGEAVAAGVLCESYLSCKKNGLSESELDEVVSMISGTYGKIDLTPGIEEILELIGHDKKNEGNRILFTLLSAIGKADYNVMVSLEEAEESMLFYKGIK